MNNRKAFTIVELLTSVTIIALLLGILLPSIYMVRAKARDTAQKSQLNTIDIALGAFKQDYGDYPPSDWRQVPPPVPIITNYCGAQKLSEALLGWDLMGFHPKTAWRADGYTGTLAPFTPSPGVTEWSYDPDRVRNIATLSERKSPYLEVATANVFKLGDLFNFSAYNPASPLALASNTFVLCDVFKVRKTIDSTGKIVTAGAPILYYKANTSHKTIDPSYEGTPYERIYNYYDNYPLVDLRKLTANGNPGLAHPFAYPPMGIDFPVFYSDKFTYAPGTIYGGSGIGYGIRDPKISKPLMPYRPDSYILISAGPDGYYGTADDIHNY
jgi:type II secretory pathway pseudopilin PulG